VITIKQKEKLKASWGEKASSMACMAEVKVYDPLSPWACYIYALNPDDEDEICCIIKGFVIEACEWRLSELARRFNCEGEGVQIDHSFRPQLASKLFKILNQGAIR
jgi:hypothetical protein